MKAPLLVATIPDVYHGHSTSHPPFPTLASCSPPIQLAQPSYLSLARHLDTSVSSLEFGLRRCNSLAKSFLVIDTIGTSFLFSFPVRRVLFSPSRTFIWTFTSHTDVFPWPTMDTHSLIFQVYPRTVFISSYQHISGVALLSCSAVDMS